MAMTTFWAQSVTACDDVGIEEDGSPLKPKPSASTIDGVSLTTGSRVLLTNQATKALNGIWTFNGAGNSMSRPADFDTTNGPAPNMTVIVNQGTKHAHEAWRLLTTGTITVDTTSLDFGRHEVVYDVEQFGARGDAKTITDAYVMASSTTLTSSTAGFTKADQGKALTVNIPSNAASGTVTTSQGDVTITGDLTSFTTQLAVGQFVTIDNGGTLTSYAIVDIDSDTSLKVTPAPPSNGSDLTLYRSARLDTTISTVTNGTTITMAASAAVTKDSVTARFGTDATAKIQAAIDACGAAGGGIVRIPKGVFKVTARLMISKPGVVIEGSDKETELLVDTTTPGSSFIPVLFQTVINSDPPALKNVGIRNLRIRFAAAGPSSGSGVQFNHCIDFLCDNVTVLGDGAGMYGSTTNGIACAYRSRDGVISRCVVDGVSKPAFYLAGAEHVRVVDCTAKNGKTSHGFSLAPPGFLAGAAFDCEFIDCHAHDCQGSGFLVSSLAPFSGSVKATDPPASPTKFTVTLPNRPYPQPQFVINALAFFNDTTTRWELLPISSVTYLSEYDWEVELATPLSAAPSAGRTIKAFFQPYRGVKILGGVARNNGGAGVTVGTNLAGVVGRDLTIAHLTCRGNAGPGLIANSVEDLFVKGGLYVENQAGITLQDIGTGQGSENQTGRIVLDGVTCYDNTYHGLLLDSVNNVTVRGGRFSRTTTSIQPYAIEIHARTVITINKGCTNIKLLDPDFLEYSTLVADTLDPPDGAILHRNSANQHAVQTGHYRIQFAGAPTSLRAPPGSEYVDTTNGVSYINSSDHLAANWSHVYSTADANLTANRVTSPSYLELFSTPGNNVFIGDTSTLFMSVSSTHVYAAAPYWSWTENISGPILLHQTRTSDAATSDMTIVSQAPHPSATTNTNPGNLVLAVPSPAPGGTDGEIRLKVSTLNVIRVGNAKLGFFGGAPASKPTVTGSRDGNAALQSLLTALTSLGLVVDSSTA
ncbi:hypothetical protein WMF45_47825 [Sorangium sp. So ce448]|uniref:hypothetical protein n=1 Tax=Sorangium sp. So ce448 TaxID=3133314 RepID=UPI003F5D75F0